MPNHGSAFYALNRDKRSIAIDLKRDDGREIFEQLVQARRCRPRQLRARRPRSARHRLRLGLRLNPRVIYCAIKGFLPGPTATARSWTSSPR